ncbi:MAG: nucleotide pyrophosphohydrolase [Pseudomonadota bacterium]
MSDSLEQLRRRLRSFARERDWEQFHSPKNLSMALIAEAAELVEHFQWLSEEQSHTLPPEKLEEVRLELADIQIFLIRIADQLGVDLVRAAQDKTDINEKRFPVSQVRGIAARGREINPDE